MSDKSEAIAELDAAHDRFRGEIADLPDAAYSETWLGTWDLSQVLAHMSGWWREMSGGFARVARGERPAPEGVDYSDPQPWNDRFSAVAKPGKAALNDWDAAYSEYRGAAEALDETFYGVDPEKGRPRIGNRLLTGAGIGHFEEHQPQLDAWLSSRKG
ncbi:MAG TPA: maleylpyruvate isomerase N-terminal domain-containing protein [Tepidiformaceae bacterium]|nr:maleylpyruvate isomerase N-terminal domain-containing protein [Tepidiformaceae bacterium]